MGLMLFWLLAPSLAKVEGMRKAGNLGKFLRTFTSGFSRLPAACSVRLAGKGGPAKNEKYFTEERSFLDINRSMGHGFPTSGPFFDRNRYVRKDRIWFQIPVRNKKKTKDQCSGSVSFRFWVSWIRIRNLKICTDTDPDSSIIKQK
jgi:hypothetical protein